MKTVTAWTVLLATLSATSLHAACATDAEIDAFVASYEARSPAIALSAGGSMEDAKCSQAKLVAALEPIMGPVVGYKAGLTSKPAQERFGVSEPVAGVLYEKSLLSDGATVSASFGAIPIFESDLLLVVGDAGINAATTTQEVMAHVSAVQPFIELADLMLAQGQPIDGVTITAMGVGTGFGVVGPLVPVEDPMATHAALAQMMVKMTAADGAVLSEVPGVAVLGHPAQSVLWLMSQGITLKPGDVVSVGSFGPPVPPAKAGGGATVTYAGLPGDPTVSVVFE